MADVKRLHYFKYQFLREPDFTDEQNYHKDMRRLHNRSLHTAGVVAGLKIRKTSDSSIEVSPGLALDAQGNEIYLQQKWTTTISVEGNATRYATVEYEEEQTDPAEGSGTGIEGNTRWTEKTVLKVTQESDINYTRDIILGRIIFKAGKIDSIDEGEGKAIRSLSGTSGSLGYENRIQDFGSLLRSGFYEGNGVIVGDVPDSSHTWSHLITSRHSNKNNNHQLQIASSYTKNDRLFFRKIAIGQAISSNPSWHEMATRKSNTFSGNQNVINGRVGIGTSEPKDKLDIYGALRFYGNSSRRIYGASRKNHNALVFKGHWGELEVKGRVIDWTGSNLHIGYENDHSANYIEIGRKVGAIKFLSGGGTAETMRISGSKVGIGIKEPSDKLNVKGGDLKIEGGRHRRLKIISDKSWSGIELVARNQGESGRPYIDFTHGELYSPNFGIRLSAPTNNSFVIEGGNVGIGTDNPKIDLAIGDTDIGLQQEGDGNLAIFTDNMERVRVSKNGKVGIRTTNPNIDLAIGDSDTGLQQKGDGKLAIFTDNRERVRINKIGNVGIGTDNPWRGMLEVKGKSGFNHHEFRYFSKDDGDGGTVTDIYSYSIFCSDSIAGLQFNTFSDLRIKKNIDRSDSRCDFETLKKLHVSDFIYIDTIEKGSRPQKKLIAQQVKQVYPDAVNMTTDFIPSVYQVAKSTNYDAIQKHLIISTDKAHGFAAGDTVRIIDENTTHEVKVLNIIDGNAFTVASEKAVQKVFVYGKQVDDFLSLDYDAIAMLNVSATQELAKRIEAQHESIKDIESENVSRIAALMKIEADYARLKRKMAQIKSTLLNIESVLSVGTSV